MDLKELDKAQRLYARIKELDAEIINIERLALLASTKKTSIKLSLRIEDLEKVQDSEKTIIDCDGSLSLGADSLGMFRFFLPSSYPSNPIKTPVYDGQLDSELTDSVCLGVLGVLLQSKIEARELAIKALNKMGVKL